MNNTKTERISFFQGHSAEDFKTYYISIINVAAVLLTLILLRMNYSPQQQKEFSLNKKIALNFVTMNGIFQKTNEIVVVLKNNSIAVDREAWNVIGNRAKLELEFKKMLASTLKKNPQIKLIKFQFENALTFDFVQALMKAGNEFGIDHFDFTIKKEKE